MSNLIFQERGWNDYRYWQTEDKKTLKRLNKIIEDIVRNGYEGIGKPEKLTGELSGWWSRRIDEKNRVVYRLREGTVEIAQCRGHYSDN